MRRRGRIGVTGATTGLGRLVLDRLDAVPVTAAELRGVGTVVHLATTYDSTIPTAERRALNVDGTRELLEAARIAGVRRVVLTTSADVYGAVPGQPVPLPDDAPLRAEPDDGLLGDHVEVERLAEHAVRTGVEVVVLRPAALVGKGYEGALLRSLAAPRLLAARGSEPLWQLCHVEDLAAALVLAADGRVSGAATAGCDGWIPQVDVERISGKRRVELPAGVALATAERLHRLGLSTSSPRHLDHLLAPVVVTSERLRAAGWSPTWTNEAALRAHLAECAAEGSSRAGAYTAAGASVALLGTAALVRQARRRRRRL
ncbi:MAG: NAD-dependent dehydratase [Frankiales bacterium]|nr:NAD-dependent dehydratase [Frankiales bacterium]